MLTITKFSQRSKKTRVSEEVKEGPPSSVPCSVPTKYDTRRPREKVNTLSNYRLGFHFQPRLYVVLMRGSVPLGRASEFHLRPELLAILAMWLPGSYRLENLTPLRPRFQVCKIRMKMSCAQGDQDFYL